MKKVESPRQTVCTRMTEAGLKRVDHWAEVWGLNRAAAIREMVRYADVELTKLESKTPGKASKMPFALKL